MILAGVRLNSRVHRAGAQQMDTTPLSFPNWKEVLATAGLGSAVEESYRQEVIALLKFCKTRRVPVTVRLAKQYVEAHENSRRGPVRAALRWFVQAARGKAPNAGANAASGRPGAEAAEEDGGSEGARADRGERRWRPMEPKPAGQDLGGPDWERALVKTMRLRGLLWRTEYSYRAWARRFAAYLAPRSPHAASGAEVQAFLTELAVQGRASASGQRQALCALVLCPCGRGSACGVRWIGERRTEDGGLATEGSWGLIPPRCGYALI